MADAHRQEGKAFGFQRIAVPAVSINGVDGYAQPLGQRGHDRRVVSAATGYKPAKWRVLQLCRGDTGSGECH